MILEACKEKIERDRRRGIKNRPVRAMVVGIPNVGKSTFINTFAGKACAKTGNKPGVTKGKQWIRLNKDVELLDTPGILWPKFDDPEVGNRLAFIGSVKDEVMDVETMAVRLLAVLGAQYPARLCERYKIDREQASQSEPYELLELIGHKRGMLMRGGEIDTERASAMLLDEYRAGRLGRITLEFPPAD